MEKANHQTMEQRSFKEIRLESTSHAVFWKISQQYQKEQSAEVSLGRRLCLRVDRLLLCRQMKTCQNSECLRFSELGITRCFIIYFYTPRAKSISESSVKLLLSQALGSEVSEVMATSFHEKTPQSLKFKGGLFRTPPKKTTIRQFKKMHRVFFVFSFLSFLGWGPADAMFFFNFFNVFNLWHLFGRVDASRSEADESVLLSLRAKPSIALSIALVSGCVAETADYEKVCRIAEKNFRSYVAYQNAERLLDANRMLKTSEEGREGRNEMTYVYKFFWFDTKEPGAEDRKAVWSKIPALQKALKDPSVQYAFWMDSDSLFMNFGKRLESLIPKGDSHLSFSGGPFCFLNAGHIMFKNDAWTKAFLEDVWETFPAPRPYEEQSAMVYALWKRSSKEKAARCREKTVILPYSPFGCCNGTGILGVDLHPDMNEYGGAFHSGDFMLHFAGGKGNKSQKMETYEKKVMQPSESIQHEIHAKPRLALQTSEQVLKGSTSDSWESAILDAGTISVPAFASNWP